MAISFKNTAVLSKKKVNNLPSIKESQEKISDHYYVLSDLLMNEAGSLIERYATCKRLHQNMKSEGLNSRAYKKRYFKDVEECVSSNMITDQEALEYKQKLLDDVLLCKKHRNVELIKKEAQSYIKTAIAYAEIDVDYINIVKELMGFNEDIEIEFIADSICYICTTYRSHGIIGEIYYVLLEYGFIFNDSQLQKLQSSMHLHPQVSMLNHFYGYQKSIIKRQQTANNAETKDNK